jgi:homoserine acetyltransferase
MPGLLPGATSGIIAGAHSDAQPGIHTMTARDYETFELGDVPLQSGLTLRNAQLAYKTYGRLDVTEQCHRLPTSTAQHTDISG